MPTNKATKTKAPQDKMPKPKAKAGKKAATKKTTTKQPAKKKPEEMSDKDLKLSEEKFPHGLTGKQELFCRLYTGEEFGNGKDSYAEAYDIDLTTKSGNATARANASRLLTNANILKRIDELLEISGWNDATMDRETLFVALQKADLGAKMRAIDHYAKIKKRINNTVMVEHKYAQMSDEEVAARIAELEAQKR